MGPPHQCPTGGSQPPPGRWALGLSTGRAVESPAPVWAHLGSRGALGASGCDWAGTVLKVRAWDQDPCPKQWLVQGARLGGREGSRRRRGQSALRRFHARTPRVNKPLLVHLPNSSFYATKSCCVQAVQAGERLSNIQKFCKPVVKLLVVWNWSQWEYSDTMAISRCYKSESLCIFPGELTSCTPLSLGLWKSLLPSSRLCNVGTGLVDTARAPSF